MTKLAIATPVDGVPEAASVCLGYSLARERILKDPNVLMLPHNGFTGIHEAEDLVRCRSRLSRVFREETDCTHCLNWDNDVVPSDVTVISRMLASGHDVVGCPYPKKRYPESYPYRLAGEDGGTRLVELVNGCVEVDCVGAGFLLVSRAAIERMTEHYREELWFSDVYGGRAYETVAIWMLRFEEARQGPAGRFRALLSEDFSFCHRWRGVGGKVWMYVGPGAPVTHVGAHAFNGSAAGLTGQ